MARPKKNAKAETSPEQKMLEEPWVLLDTDGGAPGGWHRFSKETGPPAPGSGQKANTLCGLEGMSWRNYRVPGVGNENPQTFLAQVCQSCRHHEQVQGDDRADRREQEEP